MNTIQPSKTKTLWILQANGWTWEYHPEWGNQSQKDTQCALTYKCILAIKYRIPMLHSTDPKKLNKKEGPSADAWILLKRGNKIVIRGRWREGTGWERRWGGECRVWIRCGKNRSNGQMAINMNENLQLIGMWRWEESLRLYRNQG